MNKILAISCFVLAFLVAIFSFPEGGVAVLATIVFGGIGIFLLHTIFPDDREFLVQIFLLGLIARIGFGFIVHVLDLRDFFGGDAVTYHWLAHKLVEVWFYSADPDVIFTSKDIGRLNGIGWGMPYSLAIIYSVFGRNILAAQFVFAVIGSGIAPLIFVCSQLIFKNRRVATFAAILVALYPSFIIWTGQLLKDGVIIFLLVLVMVTLLNLQKKFSYPALLLLIFGLFGIVSLRFYIFFMMIVAVVGSFVIGADDTNNNIFKKVIIVAILGLSMTYLGVVRYAGDEFSKYGSLEAVQRSRDDASKRSSSGFGEDLDVSTTGGAIAALPVGLTYLMLAPFPWQIVNFRQAITLPDMLIWWSCIPFLISGLYYSIKTRLRKTIGILIFTLMLSLVYALFQGNVGTAYRQRAQIQVFLFIFVGVGVTMHLEKKENTKMKKLSNKIEVEKNILRRKFLNEQYQNSYANNSWQDNLTESFEKTENIKTQKPETKKIKDEQTVPDIVNKPHNETPKIKDESEDKVSEFKSKEASENKDKIKKTKEEIKRNIKFPKRRFKANKSQIRKAQKALIKEKLFNGKITGKYSKTFRTAIKEYQSKQDIKITGKLDIVTIQQIGIELTKNQKKFN